MSAVVDRARGITTVHVGPRTLSEEEKNVVTLRRLIDYLDDADKNVQHIAKCAFDYFNESAAPVMKRTRDFMKNKEATDQTALALATDDQIDRAVQAVLQNRKAQMQQSQARESGDRTSTTLNAAANGQVANGQAARSGGCCTIL